MPVEIIQRTEDYERWRDWHILTVAEDGFSALMFYACNGIHGHDPVAIRTFAEMVNDRDDTGSLHPIVPISALPRRFFRDIPDHGIPARVGEFRNELRSFLKANQSTIKARRIVIDFHVSAEPVPHDYLDAIENVFNRALAAGRLDEVIVIA